MKSLQLLFVFALGSFSGAGIAGMVVEPTATAPPIVALTTNAIALFIFARKEIKG